MPLQIIRADITTLDVDAIVCPTNRHLLPGSGIDRVVYEKAGDGFGEECREKAWCPEGGAVVLNGHDLPSKYVIMTVGPHWNGGDWGELEVLEKAYRSSLECVRELSLSSVAVPLISAGYYGVPDSLSLRTATDTIRQFLDTYDCEVFIVVYNRLAFDISKGIFHDVAQYIGEEEVSRWERGYGRSRCIPRYRENMSEDDFSKDMLRFQRNGKYEIRPQKKEIIGGAVTEAEIETEDSSDLDSEEKGTLPAEGKEEEKGKKTLQEEKKKTPFIPPSCESIDPSAFRSLSKNCPDGFSEYLRSKVSEEGKTPVEVYKKANISHKLYSKIMCDRNYKPSRDTAIALALALELDEDDFSDMLSRAGFALSPADRKDLVIRYFVEHRFYDILKINEALFALDLIPIGYKK